MEGRADCRKIGRGTRVRTRDLRFWRPSLYQLSYTPKAEARLLRHAHHCKRQDAVRGRKCNPSAFDGVRSAIHPAPHPDDPARFSPHLAGLCRGIGTIGFERVNRGGGFRHGGDIQPVAQHPLRHAVLTLGRSHVPASGTKVDIWRCPASSARIFCARSLTRPARRDSRHDRPVILCAGQEARVAPAHATQQILHAGTLCNPRAGDGEPGLWAGHECAIRKRPLHIKYFYLKGRNCASILLKVVT